LLHLLPAPLLPGSRYYPLRSRTHIVPHVPRVTTQRWTLPPTHLPPPLRYSTFPHVRFTLLRCFLDHRFVTLVHWLPAVHCTAVPIYDLTPLFPLRCYRCAAHVYGSPRCRDCWIADMCPGLDVDATPFPLPADVVVALVTGPPHRFTFTHPVVNQPAPVGHPQLTVGRGANSRTLFTLGRLLVGFFGCVGSLVTCSSGQHTSLSFFWVVPLRYLPQFWFHLFSTHSSVPRSLVLVGLCRLVTTHTTHTTHTTTHSAGPLRTVRWNATPNHGPG